MSPSTVPGPPVDLRSDTLTTPTSAMRRAMAAAEVGDDVYGEDPTVRALEERAAELTGKEAAVFTTSGTMANQIAIATWTPSGQQVILDARCHVLLFEPASLALISRAVPNPVHHGTGWFGPEDVAERIAEPAYSTTGTGLVCVENTHNRAGGTLFPADALDALAAFCRPRSLPIHMDGARLHNAAAARSRPAAEEAAAADSVSFCLSKGLGCPVGSLLCGPRDFVAAARTLRQVLGGGMRQVGILAAAGLVALDTMIERLPEDHARARRLAEGLAELPGITLDLSRVETNIVLFETAAPAIELVRGLAEHGIRCFDTDSRHIRMVTHYQVDDAGIDRTLAAARQVLAA